MPGRGSPCSPPGRAEQENGHVTNRNAQPGARVTRAQLRQPDAGCLEHRDDRRIAALGEPAAAHARSKSASCATAEMSLPVTRRSIWRSPAPPRYDGVIGDFPSGQRHHARLG
jgi:hypothetical protein